MKMLGHWILILLLGGALSSCATTRRWFGGEKKMAATVTEQPDLAAAEDYEAALEKTIVRYVEGNNLQRDEAKDRVIRKKPYFFKEYAKYPEGWEDYTYSIQEKDSRARPYNANVKLPKIRYATRLHRQREKARLDENFIRETGNETLTFEYRNTRWVKIGSIFVADKCEEFVDGAWAPVREEINEQIAEQEEPGWFNRTWNRIVGND